MEAQIWTALTHALALWAAVEMVVTVARHATRDKAAKPKSTPKPERKPEPIRYADAGAYMPTHARNWSKRA